MPYLLALGAIHFLAGSALGTMSVLSAKALYDLRRPAARADQTA